MRSLLFAFGTRPEFIKLYPLIQEAKARGFPVRLVSTGQHREMLDPLLARFAVNLDRDLDVFGEARGLPQILSKSVERLDVALSELVPDLVLVHGDTSATVAASLAAFYRRIPVAHVEAGLRTGDKYSPFPEEINRKVAATIADLHFAPTERSRLNLLREGVQDEAIFVVGNSAIDMLRYTVTERFTHPVLEIAAGRKIVLITVHRRENLGRLLGIFGAINSLAVELTNLCFVFPIHLNPLVRNAAATTLSAENVHVVEPLDPVDFHNVMARSFLILTDSGGIQEEAPSLDKPVLVLRDTTERPEGIDAGTLQLLGTDPDTIVEVTRRFVSDPLLYRTMASAKNPYGDGRTSQRIMDVISSDSLMSTLDRPTWTTE